MASKTENKWQFGDFQTPLELAKKVVSVLNKKHKLNPDLIIEPTCGEGAFLLACHENFQNSKVLGFDINPEYVDKAKKQLNSVGSTDRIEIQEADFFNTDWNEILSTHSDFVLVIGNPPWVTSAELGFLNSTNIPQKSNFQNRKGIEAITGSANFDISEWMLLQHVKWLEKRKGAIALLCKYSVARKVMKQVSQKEIPLFGHIYPIDAKLYFKASVEACLFILTTNTGNSDCTVYQSIDSLTPSYTIGERDGFMVKDVHQYKKLRHLTGQKIDCVWRSGIKHDCSKVMELEPLNGKYKNGFGEFISLEDEFIYPLLKSSDLGNGRVKKNRKTVLVTQKKIGDDTSQIKASAPSTWDYLIKHRHHLESRKSSIYKNKPEFSIFGIGDYTFKNWKIAISSLYKKLNFNLIEPIEGKTVIFDDTVNFVSFDTKEEAQFAYELLTSSPALDFFESMIFWDEKRPITAQILKRLSIEKVARELGEIEQYHNLFVSRLPSPTRKSLRNHTEPSESLEKLYGTA